MRISVSACIKISTVAQHNQVQHNENTDPGFNEDQKDPEQSQQLTKSDGYFNTKTHAEFIFHVLQPHKQLISWRYKVRATIRYSYCAFLISFIIPLSSNQSQRGVDPTHHRARGGVHPGQVTTEVPSNQMKTSLQ